MLVCFPGGNVALHKEWARASLIIASPSKPQRQKVPHGAAASCAAGKCGRGFVPSAWRAARSGWRLRERPQAPPRPKENPGAQRHRPPSRPRSRPAAPQALDEPGVSDLRLRVATAGAAAVLDVEGALPTPAADGVRLVVPLALRRGPLRHGSPPRGALRAHTTGRSGGSCRELSSRNPGPSRRFHSFSRGCTFPPALPLLRRLRCISEHTRSSTAPGIRTAPRRKTAPSAAWPSCSR